MSRIPPGVCVIVLAVVAPFYPLVVNPYLKAVIVLLIFSLAALEIRTIYRDQGKRDREFRQMLHAQRVAAYPVDNLKRRTLQLADSLSDFFCDIERERPRPPLYRGLMFFAQDYKPLIAFTEKTVSTYLERFFPRVEDVMESLKAFGLQDNRFVMLYRNPMELSDIRVISERMRELGEKLPSFD